MIPLTDKDTIHFIIKCGVGFAMLLLVVAGAMVFAGHENFATFLAGGVVGTSGTLFGMLAKTSSPPSASDGTQTTTVATTMTTTEPTPAVIVPTPAPETEGEAP